MDALRTVVGPEASPRPTGSAAHAEVLTRLGQAFQDLGLTPQWQSRPSCDPRGQCAFVRNLFVELDPEMEGPLVLLVAHSDSVSAGPGASDDASGLGLVLEATRAALQRPPPHRARAVLVTDGEEIALLGARAFVAHHPAMSRVAAVVNVEARGTHGPSFLFETSAPGGPISRLAGDALSGMNQASLFTLVYRTMPNDTDLSVFLDADSGLWAANFAFLGGAEHYHTAHDDVAHLDPRSVHHQGTQAMALWDALARAEALPDAVGDDVFVSLLGWGTVRWPVPLAGWVAAVPLVWLLLLTGGAVRQAQTRWTSVAAVAGCTVGVLLGVAALALLLDAGLQTLGGTAWAVRGPWRTAAWASTTAGVGAVAWGYDRGESYSVPARYLGTWLVWAGLGLVVAWQAPLASYLVVAPAWWAAAVATGRAVVPERGPAEAWAVAGGLLGAALWFQLAWLLEDALFLSATTVSVPLGWGLVALSPGLRGVSGREVGLVAAVAGVGALVSLFVPANTLQRPAHVTYTHLEVNQRSEWRAFSAEPPPGFTDAGYPLPGVAGALGQEHGRPRGSSASGALGAVEGWRRAGDPLGEGRSYPRRPYAWWGRRTNSDGGAHRQPPGGLGGLRRAPGAPPVGTLPARGVCLRPGRPRRRRDPQLRYRDRRPPRARLTRGTLAASW